LDTQTKSAEQLSRFSSPEQLDQIITMTPRRGWVALVSLLALIALVTVWVFSGDTEIKVAGSGLLYKGGDGGMYVVITLAPEDFERVKAGMEAAAYPALDTQNIIPGHVTDVSKINDGSLENRRYQAAIALDNADSDGFQGMPAGQVWQADITVGIFSPVGFFLRGGAQ